MRYSLFVCLLLFTLVQIQLSIAAAQIVDVETGSFDTSYTYIAGADSQQLEYRCVTNGSADRLVWRYDNKEYTNPLSAYLFYGAVGSVGTFSVDCYSVSELQGGIQLTIKDSARFVVEYSGVRQVYPLSTGRTHTATIPLDTSDVKLTCEISRGRIGTPTGLTAATSDPSVTFSLANTSVQGDYTCYRDIFDRMHPVLSLRVRAPVTGTVGLSSEGTTLAIVLVLFVLMLLVSVVVVCLMVVFLYKRHKSAARSVDLKKHPAVKMTPLTDMTADEDSPDI